MSNKSSSAPLPNLGSIPLPTTPQKGQKHVRRLRVAKNLVAAYVDLPDGGKICVENFLATSAYNIHKMESYTPGRKRRVVDAVDEHSMCFCLEMTIREPWSAWANVIKRATLSELQRMGAVREMLGALFSIKNKDSLVDAELLVAAEQALGWTWWEARNVATALIYNSRECKNYFAAMKSGKGLPEAGRQLAALERKILA